jgi:hypothetical protein
MNGELSAVNAAGGAGEDLRLIKTAPAAKCEGRLQAGMEEQSRCSEEGLAASNRKVQQNSIPFEAGQMFANGICRLDHADEPTGGTVPAGEASVNREPFAYAAKPVAKMACLAHFTSLKIAE